ncbi:MAG: hypothetical protein WCF79_19735 [Rhodomicrobium sp.]
MSGITQGLAPDQGGADIGGGLNQDRQKQPSRTRRSRKLDDPFERAELRNGENEGENAQETDNPRQEPPYAEHFEEERAGGTGKVLGVKATGTLTSAD